MDLLSWLAAHDGVAHTSDLYRAGFSKHVIAIVERRGDVARVRRSWILSPEAAPPCVHAARFGGRVTCVTQAKALGLWVPESIEVHLSVGPKSSGTDEPACGCTGRKGPHRSARVRSQIR
uniref:hypothetical protein n=1 Tax=Microbacterium azadirachtae TaxID=582680 RepID=UPI001FEA058F|nr:hypothetical protein [Microbacterium azadirachtae]